MNELAGEADVAGSTVSAFFRKEFGSHAKYQTVRRRDTHKLATSLKVLSGELRPKEFLYGSDPPVATSGRGRRAGRAPGTGQGRGRDEE